MAAHMKGEEIDIAVKVGDGPERHGSGPAISPTDISRSMPTTAADHPAPELPTVLVSAVVLVDADGRVLLAQRPRARRWPGSIPGRQGRAGRDARGGADPRAREELAIDTAESCLAPLSFVSHAHDDFHLLMLVYVCRKWKGTPQPVEGGELTWAHAARPATRYAARRPAADCDNPGSADVALASPRGRARWCRGCRRAGAPRSGGAGFAGFHAGPSL